MIKGEPVTGGKEEGDDAVERYPVPKEAPVYAHAPVRISGRKRTPVWDVVAAFFVGVALLLVMWLAAVVLVQGKPTNHLWFMYTFAFWAICAYLALPRMHQIFSVLYVPDYFIGRSRTGHGILGDPVNVGCDGTAADIHAAMLQAGWVRADEITIGSTWRIIVSSLLHRSYPQAPVSHLYLFGLRQAFAYQREVDGSASQRHHVRFWPAPQGWLLPGGQPVDWLAAGTYDRAVGFSLFTGQVTHKIDANIDAERDYLIATLRYADPEVSVRVINNFSTAYHSRNGGGDQIQTDGDLPIVNMRGAAQRFSYEVKEEKDRSIARHHIPPGALLFSTFFSLCALILSIADVVLEQGWDWTITFGPLILFVLCILTTARFRWAWVGLMAISCATAVAQLHLLDFANLWNAVVTSLVVFVVLAVSASSVREWVRR